MSDPNKTDKAIRALVRHMADLSDADRATVADMVLGELPRVDLRRKAELIRAWMHGPGVCRSAFRAVVADLYALEPFDPDAENDAARECEAMEAGHE